MAANRQEIELLCSYLGRYIVEIMFEFPIFNGYYLQITYRVPSFLNEGGITRQQTEVNFEISVGIVTALGECSTNKTLCCAS